MDPNVTLQRILRLVRLDTSVFDEVRDDTRELVPSLVVAAASCILAGLGVFLWWKAVPDTLGDPDNLFVNTIILGSVFLFASFYIGAGVAWLVLSQVYKVQVDAATVIRTVGYASFPLAGSVLMFIPVLWPVFSLVPLAAIFVMTIYAVQSASNAESNQVVMASAIGFIALVLVAGLISTMTGAQDAPMGAGQFGVLFDLN